MVSSTLVSIAYILAMSSNAPRSQKTSSCMHCRGRAQQQLAAAASSSQQQQPAPLCSGVAVFSGVRYSGRARSRGAGDGAV